MTNRPSLCIATDLQSYPETPPERVQIFPFGTFDNGWEAGPQTIDRAFGEQLVANFQARVTMADVPLDIQHQQGAAPGWITDLEVDDDGIYAHVSWTPLGSQLVGNREYRYLSPEWNPTWMRPTDKVTFQNVLTRLSLTNNPFFSQMPPLVAQASPQILVGMAHPQSPLPESLPTPTDLSAEQRTQVHCLAVTKQAETGLDYEQAVLAVLLERPEFLGITPGHSAPGAGQHAQTQGGMGGLRAELDTLARQRQAAQGIGYEDACRAVLAERPDLGGRPQAALSPGSQARFSASQQLDALAQRRAEAGNMTYDEACVAVLRENPQLAEARAGRSALSRVRPQWSIASEELHRLAQAKAEAEGIIYEEACQRVLSGNPALAARYHDKSK